MASTIILITGANSGVGFATSKVLACATEAYHVIMTGRSLEKVKAAEARIKTGGIKGHLSAVQLDVTNEESVKAAADLVRRQFGRLDVLINNAAVGSLGLDLQTSFQRCLGTNVTGPALVSENFRPLLFKSKKPYSIYVSSGARTLTRNATQLSVSHTNIQNAGGGQAYQVSKAALNMLALIDYRDNGPWGLNVFVVSPGFMRSNLRGTSEEERAGWGQARDPEVSGEIILAVVQGKRDADVGYFIHKDGKYPW